jgi:hypothetical protein
VLILFLRVLKVLGVAALFSGTIGSLLPRDLADRRRFAYGLAGPGFGVAWLAGFGLAAAEEISIASLWIIGAMALSLLSLQVVLFAVGREGRRGALVAALAIAPLVATVVLMVYRPG